MTTIFAGIIVTLLTIFVENILFNIGSFSVLIILCMFLFERELNVLLFTLLLIVTSVLDTHYQLYLGSFYFAVLVALTIYWLLKRVIPSTVLVARSSLLIIGFLFYHLAISSVFFYQTQGVFKDLNSTFTDLLGLIPLVILELLIFFLLDYVVHVIFISDDRRFAKIAGKKNGL